MTALNKQALTSESARESGSILLIVAARMARRELFTPLHFVSELPQNVVSMRVFREALERAEETLQREVCKIVDGHDCMAKKLKEAEAKLEAAEKRIAEHNFENRLLANADRDIKALRQRIAELEAREVTLPAACADDEYFIDGVFQPLRYERDVERAIRAAGIGVKGE